MDNILTDLEKLMDYYNRRNLVITENISRANIPKAKAHDLGANLPKILSKKQSKKLNLKATNLSHIGINGKMINYRKVKIKDGSEQSINGNNINLPKEMLKLTSNKQDNDMAIDLYKKWLSIIKDSISDN